MNAPLQDDEAPVDWATLSRPLSPHQSAHTPHPAKAVPTGPTEPPPAGAGAVAGLAAALRQLAALDEPAPTATRVLDRLDVGAGTGLATDVGPDAGPGPVDTAALLSVLTGLVRQVAGAPPTPVPPGPMPSGSTPLGSSLLASAQVGLGRLDPATRQAAQVLVTVVGQAHDGAHAARLVPVTPEPSPPAFCPSCCSDPSTPTPTPTPMES